MATLATGQISVLDFNDAPILTAFISTTAPQTQAYDPNTATYTPDWTTGSPILKPSLFVSSMGSADQISNATVTWYDSITPTLPITTNTIYTVTGNELKITKNVLTNAIYSKTYIAEISWLDEMSGESIITKAEFSFNRVNHGEIGSSGEPGEDAIFITAWSPNGNLFKNKETTSLKAQADVYKGGTIIDTGVQYEWFKQVSGVLDEGAGDGWLKITEENKEAHGVTGVVDTNTINVTADGVVNIATFKVKATYKSKSYFDTVIFHDQVDPIMVVVESSAGTIFKNGVISSELICRLYQNGVEIDIRKESATVGYDNVYTWTKYDIDGNQDMTFGTGGTKQGKWIAITDTDIDQKAVFNVEIS